MTILLLAFFKEATGAETTTRRIRTHLEKAGHRVIALSTVRAEQVPDMDAFVKSAGIDLVVGLNAYAAGRFTKNLSVPNVIIFSGTDVNEDIKNAERMGVMTKAVEHATALVGYNDDFKVRAEAAWPGAGKKTYVIEQATETNPSEYSIKKFLRLGDEDLLFLLPAGIRSVKDPLFCAEAFSKWQKDDKRVHFLIIGSVRDRRFAESVFVRINELPGAGYIEPIPQEDLHAAMRDCTAVLNTSLSESSPNALLEAMNLGTPVIARDISGNRAVVEHEKTGLLFTTPEECIAQCKRVIGETDLREKLIKNAKTQIKKRHNMKDEAAAYKKLVEDVTK